MVHTAEQQESRKAVQYKDEYYVVDDVGVIRKECQGSLGVYSTIICDRQRAKQNKENGLSSNTSKLLERRLLDPS